MGYRTPNIDRIADEGMRFTDSYGEQSCTAGRVVVHHRPERVPHGPEQGRHARAPTSACRPRTRRSPSCSSRSATRPGSSARTTSATATSSCRRCTASTSSSATSTTSTPRRSPSTPTTRPRRTSRSFRERFGPRGVIHCWATDDDDADRDARWGRVGKQRIEDTGPLTQEAHGDHRRRVRSTHAVDFIDRQHAAGTPFFVLGQHHPHAPPHAHQAGEPRAGRALAVAVPRHDDRPRPQRRARCSTCSTSSGIADDTIVIYTTDNGPHMNTWPDGGDDAVPQREEHQLGGRVPRPAGDPLARARSRPASSRTRSSSTTTGCRRSSPRPASPDIVDKLKAGHDAGDKTFKVHIDGYNLLPYLTGEDGQEPAPGLRLLLRRRRPARAALRQLEGRVPGAARARARCRSGPSRSSRCGCRSSSTCAPTPTSGPTSRRTPTGTGCSTNAYLVLAGTDRWSREFLATFEEFPPRQKAASFTIDQVAGEDARRR